MNWETAVAAARRGIRHAEVHDGVTLDRFGNIVHPEGGFAVALTSFEVRLHADHPYAVPVLAGLLCDSHADGDEIYVGVWRDFDTPGRPDWVFDVVAIVYDKFKALHVAETTHQKAVFDFDRKQVILV